MPIVVACPCGAKLKAPDTAAGKMLACPKCKARLTVPFPTPAPVEDVATSRRKPGGTPRPKARRAQEEYTYDDEADDDQEDRPRAGRRGAPQPGGAVAQGLGIASLVAGTLGLIVSQIPVQGRMGLPVGGLGLLLAVVGLIVALSRKASGIGLSIAGSVVSLLVVGAALFRMGAFPGTSNASDHVPIPADQAAFVSTVESFYQPYRAAPNELKKSALRTERRNALEKALPSTQVVGWVGTLESMQTTSDGKAYISIRLYGSTVRVKTYNNGPSDLFERTLIGQGTPLYNTVAALSTGDLVSFTGEFLSGKDFIREASVTEEGSMTEPEFIFRFTSVARGVASAQRPQASAATGDAGSRIKEPPIQVSAIQLVSDYKADRGAADQKYGGRWLEIDGKVNNVKKEAGGEICVILHGSEGALSFTVVRCFFGDQQLEWLARLTRGQRVKLRGGCDGKPSDVHIRGCEFVEEPVDTSPWRPTAPPLGYDAVDLRELYRAYGDDQATADARYLNKGVQFTIQPEKIAKDDFGRCYIWENIFGVHAEVDGAEVRNSFTKCYFRKDQAAALAKFSPGQTLTIRGVCSGQTGELLTAAEPMQR
jgi:hypothetical protein